MATKLYPPQLEGTLPAFCKNYNKKNELTGAAMTIPFGMNRAVSRSAIHGVCLRLRTASTNTYIIEDLPGTVNLEEFYAVFALKPDLAKKINESQYYRVQMAFIDSSGTIGYYSTVGIIKCVAQPTAAIGTSTEFTNDNINFVMNTLVGIYTQNTQFGDSTEKAYSYQFRIWDSSGNLIIDSGEQVHDITSDVSSYSSRDIFETQKELITGEVYTVQYTVTTLNGLVVNSTKYKIMKSLSVDVVYPINLHAQVDYDNGYIALTLEGQYKNHIEIKYQLATIEDWDDSESTNYYVKASNDIYNIYAYENYTDWASKVSQHQLYKQVEMLVHDAEEAYNGTFVITRASSQDDYFEWETIKRFNLNGELLSNCIFYDKTVQQGITYKYALQQYNKQYVYSNKIYLTYSEWDLEHGICEEGQVGNERTITADFEDMFLFDGKRQLRVRFNPKVASFKNTIPEQKIETIGSKYPFIFRNGSVCYKEFPIEGLVSFQMDESQLFLYGNEWDQSGILDYEYERKAIDLKMDDGKVHHIAITNDDTQYLDAHESAWEYVDVDVHDSANPTIITGTVKQLQRKKLTPNQADAYRRGTNYDTDQKTTSKPSVIRKNLDLTSENIMSERYFKLKVLDWLTDGKVKLFRSPTEGNYLVRLLNVNLTPEDALGRMLHTFTCQAYEIAELTYENLLAYGIITEDIVNLYETHWCSCDTNNIMNNEDPDDDGFYNIGIGNNILTGFEISDFAPGDILKIHYVGGSDGEYEYFTVGVTGTINFNNEDRIISEVWIKPNEDTLPYNDFSRSIIYSYTGMQLTEFDMVSNVLMRSQVAEQFIGPKDNLLEVYNLRHNAYGIPNDIGITMDVLEPQEGKDAIYQSFIDRNNISYSIRDSAPKVTATKIDMLQAHRREVIPIFLYSELGQDGTLDNAHEEDLKFALTPFGQGYVNGDNILDYLNEDLIFNYNTNAILQIYPYEYYGGVHINDIYDAFSETGSTLDHLSILQTFVYKNDKWQPLEIGHKYRFYDTYTNSWWDPNEEYDPTFSINDYDSDFKVSNDNGLETQLGERTNDIFVRHNVMTFYGLGMPEKIRVGNGVYVELTLRLRVVDYEIEDQTDVFLSYYPYEGPDQDLQGLETNPATVKDIKEIYLKAKDDFYKDLDYYNVTSLDVQRKQQQYNEASGELEKVKQDIENHEEDVTQQIDAAMSVAVARIISLKNKILHIQEIIRAIGEILQNSVAPADLETLYSYGTTPINGLTTEPESAIFFSTDNFTGADPAWDFDRRNLHLDSLNEEILDPDDGYDYVNGFTHRAAKQTLDNLKEEQEALIKQYQDEIKVIQRAMGKQAGIYDDYISDETLLADVTLEALQAEYDAIQAQIDALNEQHAENLKEYGAIFDFIATLQANETNYTEATDTYLIDSANAIKEAVADYVNTLELKKANLITDKTNDLQVNGSNYGNTNLPIKYVPADTHYAISDVTYYHKNNVTTYQVISVSTGALLDDQYEQVTFYDPEVTTYYTENYVLDTSVTANTYRDYYIYNANSNTFTSASGTTFSTTQKYYRKVYIVTTDIVTESNYNSKTYYKKKIYYVVASFKEAYPELYDALNYNYALVFTELDAAITQYKQVLDAITLIAESIRPNNIDFLRRYDINTYTNIEPTFSLDDIRDLLYLNKLHALEDYVDAEDWNVQTIIYYVIDRYNATYVQSVLYFINKYTNKHYELVPVENAAEAEDITKLYYIDNAGYYKHDQAYNSNHKYYDFREKIESSATTTTDDTTTTIDESKIALLLSYLKTYNSIQSRIPNAVSAKYTIKYEINMDNDTQVQTAKIAYETAQAKLTADEEELNDLLQRKMEIENATGQVATDTAEWTQLNNALIEVERRIAALRATVDTNKANVTTLQHKYEDAQAIASHNIANEIPTIISTDQQGIEQLVEQARQFQKLINDLWTSLTSDEKEAAITQLNANKNSLIGSYENSLAALLQAQSDSATRIDKMKAILATYQEQIDKLLDYIKDCQDTIDEQQQEYDDVNENHLDEGDAIFKKIFDESKIRQDLVTLKSYIDWLKGLSDSIQTDISNANPNIKSGQDYVNYYRTIIEMYEDEAFELLHFYDALPEDLNEGYGGYTQEGLDYKFQEPNNIHLMQYKNILYLGLDLIPPQMSLTIQNNLQQRTSTALGGSQLLKNVIRSHLVMPENPTTKKDLGVIYTTSGGTNNTPLTYTFYMVEISEDSKDSSGTGKYHPSYKMLDSRSIGSTPWHWVHTDPLKKEEYELVSRQPVQATETTALPEYIYWSLNDEEYTRVDNPDLSSTSDVYYRWSRYWSDIDYYIYDEESKEYYPYGGSTSQLDWVNYLRNDENPNIYAKVNKSSLAAQSFVPYTILYNATTDLTYNSLLDLNMNILEANNRDSVIGEQENIVVTAYSNDITAKNNLTGSIVYDHDSNGKDHNSLSALKALEIEKRYALVQYLITYAIMHEKLYEYKEINDEYMEQDAIRGSYQSSYQQYDELETQCQVIYDTRKASGRYPDNSETQIQLKALIKTAHAQYLYYLNLYNQINDEMENNVDYKQLAEAKAAVRRVITAYTSYADNVNTVFKSNEDIYIAKVDHYLHLVLDDNRTQPDNGIPPLPENETVIQIEDFPNAYYDLYGFTLNDKDYEASLTEATLAIKKYSAPDEVNKVYDFTAADNLSKQFIQLHQNFDVVLAKIKSIFNDPNACQDNIIGIIPLLSFKPVDADSAVMPKFYINEFSEYTLLTEYSVLGEDSQLYIIDDVETKRHINSLINGSLKGLESIIDAIASLEGTSPVVTNGYIGELYNEYKDTYALYNELYEQKNSTTDEILENLQRREAELENIIKALEPYKDIEVKPVDVEARLTAIKYALTDYFYYLTCAYVEQVEKRFGVV